MDNEIIITRSYIAHKKIANEFINEVADKDLHVQVNLGIPFTDENGSVQCKLDLTYRACYSDEVNEAITRAVNKVIV